MRSILITGGAGFIGINLVKHLVNKYPNYYIVNLDKLTYASNIEALGDLEEKKNYTFIKGDILDDNLLKKIFKDYGIDSIIHLAAESHVDNSIANPKIFAETNILGTLTLINSFLKYSRNKNLFYHISTDEVYGDLGLTGSFSEKSNYFPNSPYSASKASSDHFVRAYGKTYQMPYIISHCSNNYGQFQNKEKFIPTIINSIINKIEIPIYGDGSQIRDWIYVKDHVEAIDLVFHNGSVNNTYCIGGLDEKTNIDLVNLICDKLDSKLNSLFDSKSLIKFVKDRPGHDFRYSLDINKINNQLGWAPKINFEQGINKTIDWYINK